MISYRWNGNGLVPDEGLPDDTWEDLAQRLALEEYQSYGNEFDSMRLVSYRAPDSLVHVLVIETPSHWDVIYFEHLGKLLACLGWLLPIMERGARIEHDAAVQEQILVLTNAGGLVETEVNARLYHAGYTHDEVEQLRRQENKRLEQRQKQRKAAS